MIISITGATGFIGSHLADRMLALGHSVRALVRRTSNLRWLAGKAITLVEGDILDTESLRPFIEHADYIFHVAGVVKARSREEYFQGNEIATRNLLEATKHFAPHTKRFLHVSSQTVSGPSQSADRPVKESDPCAPITTYGESKRAAELAVQEYSPVFPWTIVRPPAVYGPRDTEIFIYFQTIAKGLHSMIGFDEKKLSLIHATDLVRGMHMAAEAANTVGQTYFISSEKFYSWPEVGKVTASVMDRKYFSVRVPHFMVYTIAIVAQTIAALQKRPATLNLEKARDITRAFWTCDPSKALKDFGFKQERTLEEGIRQTIEWYKKERWLK